MPEDLIIIITKAHKLCSSLSALSVLVGVRLSAANPSADVLHPRSTYQITLAYAQSVDGRTIFLKLWVYVGEEKESNRVIIGLVYKYKL